MYLFLSEECAHLACFLFTQTKRNTRSNGRAAAQEEEDEAEDEAAHSPRRERPSDRKSTREEHATRERKRKWEPRPSRSRRSVSRYSPDIDDRRLRVLEKNSPPAVQLS